VKIRGVGVDIGEVEARLLDHSEIKEAVVIARETPSGEVILVAYVVPNRGRAPTVTNLRALLTNSLPDYMIPADFISLDRLPLTATGKVDRRALPDHSKMRPRLQSVYVAPKTWVEAELASIWSEILALQPIGIHDNLFELGGHSLAAMRIVSRVIKRFQINPPVELLFQALTVAEMAAVVTEHRGMKIGAAELERILAEVESLSEQKARQMFADATGTNAASESDE